MWIWKECFRQGKELMIISQQKELKLAVVTERDGGSKIVL